MTGSLPRGTFQRKFRSLWFGKNKDPRHSTPKEIIVEEPPRARSQSMPALNGLNVLDSSSDVCSESCPCHQVCPCCLDAEAEAAAAVASTSSTNSQPSTSSTNVMQINSHAPSLTNEDQYIVVVSDLNSISTRQPLTVRSETENESPVQSSRESEEQKKRKEKETKKEEKQRDVKEKLWMKEVDERMRRMELLLMSMKDDTKDKMKEKVKKEKDKKVENKKDNKKRLEDEIPPFNALARVLYILRSPDGPRERICPFCGSTAFIDVKALSKHLLGETGRNPHLSGCGPLKGWTLDQSRATDLFVDMALKKLNKK